jgi:hypothetical protein
LYYVIGTSGFQIYSSDDKIALIDWDTAGWGYMGEGIASLIADESDVNYMTEYYNRCIIMKNF